MTRRLLILLIVGLALSACQGHHLAQRAHAVPPTATCTPPAGGRCAHDVAWTGPILVSPDGLRLYGELICGGTLQATETIDRVTIRLHLGAMGPGTMTCARVDVGVRLHSPLGDRTVFDSVTGHVVRINRASGPPLML